MPLNEGEDQFEAFLVTHSKKFSDNDYKRTTASKGTELDQKSIKVLPNSPFEPIFPEGMIVRATAKGKKQMYIADKIILTGSGLLRYKIRPLNGTKICTVAEKDL